MINIILLLSRYDCSARQFIYCVLFSMSWQKHVRAEPILFSRCCIWKILSETTRHAYGSSASFNFLEFVNLMHWHWPSYFNFKWLCIDSGASILFYSFLPNCNVSCTITRWTPNYRNVSKIMHNNFTINISMIITNYTSFLTKLFLILYSKVLCICT